MSTMREHLHDLHRREAQYHTAKAGRHAAVGSHYQKLASALGKAEVSEAQKDTAAILEALAAVHQEESQEHAGMAKFHADCGEKCMKAADGDLNKLVPTSVSAVAPTRPGITPVLRPGQRELPANMDPQISKILGTDPEDWHTEETSLRQ